MAYKMITPLFATAPQLPADDVVAAARAGFRSIISNRPDHEETGQPTAAEIGEFARASGMDFAHVPVEPGKATDADADAMKEALARMPQPVLGFCRSGARAATLWALAEAERGDPVTIVELAKGAGFDLSDLKPMLQRRADGSSR